MHWLPNEILFKIFRLLSLEDLLSLGDTSGRLFRLSEAPLGVKTQKRNPYIWPNNEEPVEVTWRVCARMVVHRAKIRDKFVVLDEKKQDALMYSLKMGMKTLSYVFRSDEGTCTGLLDENNHERRDLSGFFKNVGICQENAIYEKHYPYADLSRVKYPKHSVTDFLQLPHPQCVFFCILESTGWFLYGFSDTKELIPIFGPFSVSQLDTVRVFTFNGMVWVDYNGAVLPFVVDTDYEKAFFVPEKLVHGYPEQHGRGFIQCKGKYKRFLFNENLKRVCDLKDGLNYYEQIVIE